MNVTAIHAEMALLVSMVLTDILANVNPDILVNTAKLTSTNVPAAHVQTVDVALISLMVIGVNVHEAIMTLDV